jgi:hypothetical protein
MRPGSLEFPRFVASSEGIATLSPYCKSKEINALILFTDKIERGGRLVHNNTTRELMYYVDL